jgi:hypothetical protein
VSTSRDSHQLVVCCTLFPVGADKDLHCPRFRIRDRSLWFRVFRVRVSPSQVASSSASSSWKQQSPALVIKNNERTTQDHALNKQDSHLAQDDVPSPIPAVPHPPAIPDCTANTDDHDHGTHVDKAEAMYLLLCPGELLANVMPCQADKGPLARHCLHIVVQYWIHVLELPGRLNAIVDTGPREEFNAPRKRHSTRFTKIRNRAGLRCTRSKPMLVRPEQWKAALASPHRLSVSGRQSE